MQRLLVSVLGLVFLLTGCSLLFGGTPLQTVPFTVLEASGNELGQLLPQAKFVNSDDRVIDILITGEALKNDVFPLMIQQVKANREEIQIILDWDKGIEAYDQSIHKLIRLKKGDWWSAKIKPHIRLMNTNGGELNGRSQPSDIRRAVLEHLPEIVPENTYLEFILENMTEAEAKGVWEATVTGTPEENDHALSIVAKFLVEDQDLKVRSGKVTTYSSHNGTVMKVEELELP